MLMFVMNRTEDFNLQFVTADERINKILQQFEFTDVFSHYIKIHKTSILNI